MSKCGYENVQSNCETKQTEMMGVQKGAAADERVLFGAKVCEQEVRGGAYQCSKLYCR